MTLCQIVFCGKSNKFHNRQYYQQQFAQSTGVQNIPTAPLQRGKTPPNVCPVYDTKQSDAEVPVMLDAALMQSTPSLPSLPGPLRPGMAVHDRALSMG